MEKKSVGFGVRGTILIIYQMLAYVTYCSFTNYPQNVLSEQFGGITRMTLMTTIAGLMVFVVQYFIIAPRIGRIGSIKKWILIVAGINLVFTLALMFIPSSMLALWDVCYVAVSFLTQMYVTFFGGLLIGNWFPRRKGTVMGIVTIVFPLVTGILLNIFMLHYISLLQSGNMFAVAIAFMPYLIVTVISMIICAIFVKDFPEQCGAFRDNDKSFTPEMANEMLAREIEARKNSVWKRSEIWKCRDWWFMALPAALLLALAIAFMVQIIPVLMQYNEELMVLAIPGFPLMSQGYSAVLVALSVAACFGSWILGIIDTKFGTKTALIITSVLMLLAGVLGATGNVWGVVAAAMLLGLFMGASSNFGLSAIVRYWRSEDFPAVYAGQPPLNFIISAISPFLVASIAARYTYTGAFKFVAVMGVLCIVLLILFNPRNIVKKDNKLREKAGLTVDDVLEKKFETEGIKSK